MQCISTHLIERHCLIEQAQTRRYVPREGIDVTKIYESLSTDSSFLNHDSAILYTSAHPIDDIADDVIYLTCTNYKVRELARWCNKNLLARVTVDSRPTLAVRIRIATSMLNNLNLDKTLANYIHDNIVQNTYGAAVDYSVGSLPF